MDLFALTGIFLAGTALFVPVAYFSSCIFHSLLWGTIVSLIVSVAAIIEFRKKFKNVRLDRSSFALFLFALVFSSWIMFKTFHGGPGGELFVGSNNVFDFGHSLGLLRSFSWGSNIPVRSPFESGMPFFYHFFFYFLVALLEYFRVPIVWAMNIPSILSFTALLIVVYYLPLILAKQKPIVGWVAVLLTITNSSLTFWRLLAAKGLSLGLPKEIWRLPTYPFAGPFDGSVISLFVTLNNFVNQRHLAFSIALGLLVYIYIWKILQEKRGQLAAVVTMGILTGVLFLWNIAVYPVVFILCSMLLMFRRRWRLLAVYTATAFLAAMLIIIPYWGNLVTAFLFFGGNFTGAAASSIKLPVWNIAGYLWQNLGLLPVAALIGFVTLAKKMRSAIIPFVVLFAAECLLAGIGHRGFDQKFYSFLIIGIDVLAAMGAAWLWQKQKILAIIVLIILTISGLVDLMPIKNEFAFPLVGKDVIPVISWIHNDTPKNAVFVSYSDIIDPVVFAGRTNYFGFFGNIGYYDRSPQVGKIYDGDIRLAKRLGISYILVPKWQKTDFSYKIHLSAFPVVFEDARYKVFAVQ